MVNQKLSKNLQADMDACVKAGGTVTVDIHKERWRVSLNGTDILLVLRHGQWHRDEKATKTARLLAIDNRRLWLLAELRQLETEQHWIDDKE